MLFLRLRVLEFRMHIFCRYSLQLILSHQSRVLCYLNSRSFISGAVMQFNRRWKFGWGRFSEVDLFTDRHESNAETLSQAIRAAASEEPDADGSVLFGQLKGTVVGLRYYSGVVRISQGLFYSSSGQRRQHRSVLPHRSETCRET